MINACHNLEGEFVYGPIDIGVYKVEFSIAYYENDPNGDMYEGVVKTVTVEIVA